MSTAEEARFREDGFFLRSGFASAQVCEAMFERAVEMARADIEGVDLRPSYILRENRLDTPDRPGEERTSKIFRLHRDEEIFHSFATEPRVTSMLRGLLGDEIDCFLSQFIFKHSGSLGQPWHQDGFYFPFDRSPQIGLWLAITEVHENNSPLSVVPGSHRENIHAATTDPRPDAPFGYVEIVDYDMSAAVPVLMKPGDLLVFHSHLMHSSTDHRSGEVRAAMVYHYADASTVDGTEERWGMPSPNNDWMPVLR